MNPLSNPFYLLPPLVVLAVSLILVLVVWRGTRPSFTSYIFCGFLMSIGLWSLLIYGMRSSPDVYHAVLWDRAVPAVGFASYLLYYHFTLAYTNTSGQRRILLVGYLLLVLLASVSPTDLVIKEMRLEYYGYAPTAGAVLLPFMIIGILFLLGGGAYNFLKHYSASHSHNERNRILYLLIAMLFPISGALLDGLSNLPPASIWCNLIFCIICTVAIMKYHLLDISIVVRKSLVYLLISAVVAIPYVAILYLLYYVFKPTLGSWWVHPLIILLLAVVLRPLYSRAQQFVDRLFYRDRYDHLRALHRFSYQAQSIVNLKELGSNLIRLVSTALRTSSASLLLPSEGKSGLVVVSSTGLESPPSGVVLRDCSPLVKWLELHGDILSSEQLDIVPQLQSFLLSEKNNLERMGAKLYVPIKTNQSQLSGILVLGQKLSQQSYSNEDRQLLITLSNQMATNLENARLYNVAQRELRERKQAEDALQESEEFSSSLLSNSPNPMLVINSDTSIRYVNPALEKLTGFSYAELIGRKAPYPWWTKETLQKTRRDLDQAMSKGVKQLEQLFKKKNGERIWVEITSTPVRHDREFKYHLASWVDITKRKQADEKERQLQQELHFSSRLASIGELAAGVAHEINNPLAGIMGFSERLLRKSTDETSKRDLERIHGEAQRAAKVVENLRTFARRKEPKKECSNIHDILQRALEMRIYELKTSNIEIITELASTLPLVMVDFHQVQQVFLNIIMNAEQAMTEANCGGKLAIKTQQQKGYVRITFTDDGPGISNENLNKVFDPFFTTRGEKGGTGLGLSLCHGIVTEHGGKIYARSKLRKGATFFVELPIMSETVDKNKLERKEAIPRPHKHDRS